MGDPCRCRVSLSLSLSLLPGEEGELFVLKAGARLEVLASNSMGEKVWASPAIADGRLYIRGLQHLFAIGQSR